MRKEVYRLSMAAILSASISACNNEVVITSTATPEIPGNLVFPGGCDYANADLQICNLSNRIEENVGAWTFILRADNGSWIVAPEPFFLALGETLDFKEGFFTGLSLEFDLDKNLYYRVNEPLLSATPIPTPYPNPNIKFTPVIT